MTFYLIIGFIAGLLIGRYWTHRLQNTGEALVSASIESSFTSPDYHLLNNVTLAAKEGTTQVDHILVSRFGIFVIETKHYKGWIFGSVASPNWTQTIYKKKSSFQNPLRQNYKHIKTLQAMLDFLPSECIHSVVIFTGDAEFKTEMPINVMKLEKLKSFLRSFSTEAMSENRMQFCIGRIEAQRYALTHETDIEHTKRLNNKYGRP